MQSTSTLEIMCNKEHYGIDSDNKKGVRESGVEVLRMLAACMVVWLHMNLPWAISIVNEGINSLLVHIIEVIAVPAVDIFVLISGYFMYNRNERSIGKPSSLLLQLFVINALFSLIHFVHHYPVSSFDLKFLIPDDYFITLYIALYFISPYISTSIRGLRVKQCRTVLIVCMILLSVYPIVWEYVNLYTNNSFSGVSTVSRWHNDTGQNIVTFMLLFLIGSIIKKIDVVNTVSKKTSLLVWFLTSLLMLLLYYIDEKYAINDIYGCPSLYYHNPLVIVQAASLFLFFKKITFHSRVINRLAAAAFTCYLLKDWMLFFLKREYFLQSSPYFLLLYYIVIAFFIYILSYLFWEVYNYFTSWFLKRLDKIKIHYYD